MYTERCNASVAGCVSELMLLYDVINKYLPKNVSCAYKNVT